MTLLVILAFPVQRPIVLRLPSALARRVQLAPWVRKARRASPVSKVPRDFKGYPVRLVTLGLRVRKGPWGQPAPWGPKA